MRSMRASVSWTGRDASGEAHLLSHRQAEQCVNAFVWCKGARAPAALTSVGVNEALLPAPVRQGCERVGLSAT